MIGVIAISRAAQGGKRLLDEETRKLVEASVHVVDGDEQRRGLLYDLMTPSNPNGTRSAARIPKMLACIFSAPHVAFARLYSEGA